MKYHLNNKLLPIRAHTCKEGRGGGGVSVIDYLLTYSFYRLQVLTFKMVSDFETVINDVMAV